MFSYMEPIAPCFVNLTNHIHRCQVKFQQIFPPKIKKDKSVDAVIISHASPLNISDTSALFSPFFDVAHMGRH